MTGPDQAFEVPHQLPSDVYGFTGRTAELAHLDALLAGTQGTAAVVITVVAGTAGVGKTALAVRWAHSVGDRFPDGQLYVDLRGYDPDQPTPPADALAAALRALGVEGTDLPVETAERSARYRTMLAGRRVLIVLDNACAVDQIRPLLPGAGSCFVLVTSRDSLTGLVVRHGARRLDLDLLPVADGVDLLRRLVGDRVDADPGAAAALVRCCARLPLALRIAAEFAGSRPSTPLATLVAELADERGPLDRLDVGADERTAVRAVFSWSYRRLPPGPARLFGLLGTCPAPEVDGYAMAALLGSDLEAARHPLDTLIRAHLVQEATPGRYGMNDLLRAYAAECAEAGAAPDRRAALTRLVHYYLSTAADAMGTLYPAEQHRRPRVPAGSGPRPDVTAEPAAREWLDAERDNLVAVTGFAAAGGWPTQAGYLAQTLWRHLDMGAHYDDALTVNQHGLRAACEHDDRYGEAVARHGVGIACYRLGRYDESVDQYRKSAEMFRLAGDAVAEVRVLANLGTVYSRWGRHAEALALHQRALAVYADSGDRAGEALALGRVGLELGRLARYEESVDHLQQALAAVRKAGFPAREEAEVLHDLGRVHLWWGRHDEALAFTRQALDLGREAGDPYRETEALNSLAEILRAMGRLDEALAHHRTADEGRTRLAAPDHAS